MITVLRVASRLLAPCLALALFLAAPAGAATIFTWTDEAGVKHFSNVPPPQGAKNLHEVKPKPAPAPQTDKSRTAGAQPAQAQVLTGGATSDQHRILEELRILPPDELRSIYLRMLKDCGSDAACRSKVDDLMRNGH